MDEAISTARQILKHVVPKPIRYRLRKIQHDLHFGVISVMRVADRRRWNILRLFLRLPSISLSEMVGEGPVPLEPAILEDICLPPFREPTTHDDYTPLMTIVKVRRPTVVIELGTAMGNLTANICRHAPDARVLTVNSPAAQQSGRVVSFKLTEDEIGCVYRRHGFADRVTQIYSNTRTLDLSLYIDQASADIAIIDACHDREYVLNDFHKVRPYVKEGGIVLFHDTHPAMEDHLLGSYSACMMLRLRGYNIRHLKKTWWGLWIKPTHGRAKN